LVLARGRPQVTVAILNRSLAIPTRLPHPP
jgi:hypothetical protein